MRFSEDSKLNSALGLDTSTKFEYKQVVGFGDYLIFSDCLYPATMGRVVVLHQDTLVKEIIGEPGDTLGEYLFISEDAPGGNIVVGISQRVATDSFDHIYLYKLLPSGPDLQWFLYTSHATHTMISPPLKSLDDLLAARGQKLSASFSYGSFLNVRNGSTKQTRMCAKNESFMNGKCNACSDPTTGTVGFQAMACKSCGDMWFDTKDNPEISMEYLIAEQICDDPQAVYFGGDAEEKKPVVDIVEEAVVEKEVISQPELNIDTPEESESEDGKDEETEEEREVVVTP